MATEFFISPTISYTCKNKAVVTLNGAGASLTATLTYADASTATITVAPGGKITLNSGEKIETAAGTTISGIEVGKDLNEETATEINVVAGLLQFNSYQAYATRTLVPVYDSDGFPNYSAVNPLLDPTYIEDGGAGGNQAFTPAEVEQVLEDHNLLVASTEDIFLSNPSCSSVWENSSLIGVESGFIFSVSFTGENIDIVTENIDLVDPVNQSGGGRKITSFLPGTKSFASYGQLSPGTYQSIDPLANYPHLEINGEDAYVVMAFFPWLPDFDDGTNLPIVLNESGNLDIDYYLTTETYPLIVGDQRHPFGGFRIPKNQFLYENLKYSVAYDEFTKNNPIMGIGIDSVANGSNTFYCFEKGEVVFLGEGYPGNTDPVADDFVEEYRMKCVPWHLVDYQEYVYNYRILVQDSTAYFDNQYGMLRVPPPLITYYYDPDSSPAFFGYQATLLAMFSSTIKKWTPLLNQNPPFWQVGDLEFMPLQRVFNRDTLVYKPTLKTAQDLYEFEPLFFEGGYDVTIPVQEAPISISVQYIPDISQPLFNVFPNGILKVTGLAKIDEPNQSYWRIGYTNQGMVFFSGLSNNWRDMNGIFGTGGRAKVHCLGVSENGNNLIAISDGGICATGTYLVDPNIGETIAWSSEDVSYLTKGNAIRAISGRYAVGDKGTILRKELVGWKKIQPNPLPPNFNNLDFTVCQYVVPDVGDPYYVLAAKGGYVCAFPA